VLAAILLGCLAAPTAEATDVTVMVRNLYVGGDYVPTAVAPSEQFEEEAGKLWLQVEGSDIPARMRLVADEIARARPLVVGLQEAALWATGPKDGAATRASNVRWNMLSILLRELRRRGQRYRVAVNQADVDVEASTSLGFDARFRNSNVTLVRDGVRFRRRGARKFRSQLVFPSPTLGPTATNRGFGSVDVTVDDVTFRVVNTHLEAYSADIRADQARELVQGPLRSRRPVVLVGDLNSQRTQPSPEGDAYDAVVGAGFVERRTPRFNCCFDGDLKTGKWDHNIDFVLSKPKLRLLGSYLTGNRRKTQSGLWASDHGGIVSRLRFP